MHIHTHVATVDSQYMRKETSPSLWCVKAYEPAVLVSAWPDVCAYIYTIYMYRHI
jgi:hypothetical protein